MSLDMKNLPENFCKYPFMALYIGYPRDESVRVSFCCEQKTTLVPFSMGDYSGITEWMKETRQKFIDGEKLDSCSRCWISESEGVESKRLSNRDVFHDIEDHINDPKIRLLDVEYSTKCNAACRMCGPGNSSLWTQQAIEIKKQGDPNLIKIYNVYPGKEDRLDDAIFDFVEKNSHDVREFEFEGGEPQLQPNFHKTLGIVRDDQHISFTTNSSIDSSKVLNKQKNIDTYLSIDGIGDIYEYIRWPLKWNRVKDNIDKLHDDKIAQISVCLTVYNVFDLANIHNTFYPLKVRTNPSLAANRYMGVEYLPPEVLEEAIIHFMRNVNEFSPYCEEIVDILDKKCERSKVISDDVRKCNLTYLRTSTIGLDKMRNQNYEDTLHPLVVEVIRNA